MKDKMKFLPLLALYIFVVLVTSTNIFRGDEGRYVMFADNLTHGYYSPRGDIDLWSGPGYPIVLVPFVLLKLPWWTAKLLNALFLYMGTLYFYYTLRFYTQKRTALRFSYLLGIYPPFLRCIHALLPETLAILLVCGFLFHFCKLYREDKNSWVQLLISSVYLAYLALTKIFFGYVILSGLLLFLFLYLLKKGSALKKTLLVYSFALFCCLPYLFYTYSLTDRIFYWGNSGGASLYWMSTPYQDELGDWYGSKEMSEKPHLFEKHQKFFSELEKLPSIQRDNELKKRAIHNIARNPAKYFKNWMANIGRLLFNYPYSYTLQKLSTYFYIIPNAFLVVFSVLCIYPTYLGRRAVPYEIYALILFSLISFGGSSLLSAYNRQFCPLVPIIALWIIFTLIRILKITMRE